MKETQIQIFLLIAFLFFAVPASITDIKKLVIPNWCSFSGILVISILRLCILKDNFLSTLVNLIAGALFFYTVRYVTGKRLGMGDVKFSALMGVFNRFPGWFTAVFIASISALLFTLAACAAGKIKRESKVPFAPFLSAGSIGAYFLHNVLISFIQGYLH